MKTHRFDGLSFLAGIFMTGTGLAFLLLSDLNDVINIFTDAGSWFWPVVFIAIGVAILAPLASRRARAIDKDDDETETQVD